jgi:hypothetical protein
MTKKSGKPSLRVVGSNNNTDPLFADYGPAVGGLTHHPRRSPAVRLFARIYFDDADRLFTYRASGAAWRLLVEIDRLILAQRGRNPMRLYSPRLHRAGFSRATRKRALQQLIKAGLIEIEQDSKGLSPWVRHLGYSVRR